MEILCSILLLLIVIILVALGAGDRYMPECPQCGRKLKSLGYDFLCVECYKIYLEDEIPK